MSLPIEYHTNLNHPVKEVTLFINLPSPYNYAYFMSFDWLVKFCTITLYLIETPFNTLQTEQTQISQLLYELPDQGLLCLLIDI